MSTTSIEINRVVYVGADNFIAEYSSVHMGLVSDARRGDIHRVVIPYLNICADERDKVKPRAKFLSSRTVSEPGTLTEVISFDEAKVAKFEQELLEPVVK